MQELRPCHPKEALHLKTKCLKPFQSTSFPLTPYQGPTRNDYVKKTKKNTEEQSCTFLPTLPFSPLNLEEMLRGNEWNYLIPLGDKF